MATSLLDLLREFKVIIPILQRDYAQGRVTGKVPLIRENILNSLCSSIKAGGEPLELDFIYGYTKSSIGDENGKQDVFYPLDGQQRLTTLFLFHWFVAVKEGYLHEATLLLEKFNYETRHSSGVFCSELVKYQPESLDYPIKESIINQPWFFTAWNNDPTISSMLTMLNAIQEKVSKFDLQNVWQAFKAEKAAVVFHLLPMDKLGLPDDLYIKMNSRGKELTEFEYFKSQFSELLKGQYLNDFSHKIDQTWSDLFWDLYKGEMVPEIAQKVDAAFLRFFRFITDIIIAKENIQATEDLSELNLFRVVYSIEENVKFLFSILDTFVENNKKNPEFFSSAFYINESDYSVDKTRLYFVNKSIELFKTCSDLYDAKQRNNPFSIGEQLLLYGCIVHLQNNTVDFKYRIRKLRNLISNSEDTVRKENMSSLIKSVDGIIVSDTLEEDSRFNKTQISEEEDKALFLQSYPNMLDTICKLEDHDLLRGCVAIFKLMPDLEDYAKQFHRTFSGDCNYDSISRALFTFGDYSQRTNWSRFLGNLNSSTWRELFTPSQRRGDFLNTQNILYKLLDELNMNTSLTIEAIIDSYLDLFEQDQLKEKDWRYYFINYQGFRRHQDGFYYWPDATKPYECIMMRRKTLGGFYWDSFLFTIRELSNGEVDLENNYGGPLTYVMGDITLKIKTLNDSFKLEALDTDSLDFLKEAFDSGLLTSEYTLEIKQSSEGLDIEDRVKKGLQIMESLNKLSTVALAL